ncbi:MAG: hypothetical protein R6V62_10795, partial [Candidatus Fermentibacteraceae bacterium]
TQYKDQHTPGLLPTGLPGMCKGHSPGTSSSRNLYGFENLFNLTGFCLDQVLEGNITGFLHERKLR